MAGQTVARRDHVEPGGDALGRAAKGDKATVAHRLDELAAVRERRIVEPAEDHAPNLVGAVRAQPGVQPRGLDDVGHQNGERASGWHYPKRTTARP